MKISLNDINKTFYAVRKGIKPGVYTSWEDCKAQIHKYSGAEYKKFNNRVDAENFIKGIEENNDISDIDTTNYYKAYTDGSYDKNTKIFSYGVVIINDNDFVIDRFYQGYKDNEFAEHRNIAGECFGVLKALDYCIKYNIKNILIYHDYLGLAQWANGAWETNTAISKYYKAKIDEYREPDFNFKFIWVRGHQGNRYNEQADQLAKLGLNVFEQTFM
jgi:ribonuclease HI